jgi:hypothetical protein
MLIFKPYPVSIIVKKILDHFLHVLTLCVSIESPKGLNNNNSRHYCTAPSSLKLSKACTKGVKQRVQTYLYTFFFINLYILFETPRPNTIRHTHGLVPMNMFVVVQGIEPTNSCVAAKYTIHYAKQLSNNFLFRAVSKTGKNSASLSSEGVVIGD